MLVLATTKYWIYFRKCLPFVWYEHLAKLDGLYHIARNIRRGH